MTWPTLGFKCNMTDIQAAMGRVQLRKYPHAIRATTTRGNAL